MKSFSDRIQCSEYELEERSRNVALPAAALIMIIVTIILLFGITMLYSTSYGMSGTGYFARQLMWTAIGLVGMTSVLFIGYRRISDWSLILMMGTFVLLMIADFCFPAVKGAHRWIKIPGIGNIQPSEYAKVVISLFLAKFLSDRARYISTRPYAKVFWPGVCIAGCVIGMVLLGKDLGTTLLLTTVVISSMFVAGVPMTIIIPGCGVLGVLGFFYIKYHDAMRWARLTTFLDPEAESAKNGYQLWHSLLALGSGKWFGLGFTESRMKQNYLPEAHTDFILSIVGEELGLVFLLMIMVAYLIFVLLCYRIASVARTRQGMILAFCIGTFIGIQAMINIGVITGAFPTKGMPAPFISYGGSNLVTCLTATGLVLSVALDASKQDYQIIWKNNIRSAFTRFLHSIKTFFIGER